MIRSDAQPAARALLAEARALQACQEQRCLVLVLSSGCQVAGYLLFFFLNLLLFLRCLSSFPLTEQLLEFMHQLPAFANMTMSVRRELCAVMVFAVVERAGTIVLNDGEEVCYSSTQQPCLVTCL